MDRHKLQQRYRYAKLYLSRVLDYPLAKPSLIAVFLTPRCNFHCKMCGFPGKAEEPELSTTEVKQVLDKIHEFGVHKIDLAGGEPFLRTDLMEILEYAASLNFQTNITTNGWFLDAPAIEQLFKHKVFALQLSLDGANAETHDYIRGAPGSYARIIKAAEIIAAKRSQENYGPLLNATTVIQRHNIGQLMSIVDLTTKLGFVSITLQPVADDNMNIMKKDPTNPLRPTADQLPILDSELTQLRDYRIQHGFVCNSDQHLTMMKQYFHNEKLDHFDCYSGFFTGTVSNDGMFRSICMGPFGDLRTHTLAELWKSKQAKLIRRRVKRCKSPCLYPCWVDPDSV